MTKSARGVLGAVLIAMALTASGCSDDRGTGPRVDRSEVAGIYHLSALTFDPRGSLPEVDIIDRLEEADLPELILSRSDDTFQSITRDPSSGRFIAVDGKYTYRNRVVRLQFPRATDAERLLLPQNPDFEFNSSESTLTYRADTEASLSRLRDLVPEYLDEQLPDPVLGELYLVFRMNRR